MNLEKNIKGLCSKNGIHFQDFLSDFDVEHVHELSFFDVEAICDEYEIPMQTMFFKSIALESDLLNKIQKIKLIILILRRGPCPANQQVALTLQA